MSAPSPHPRPRRRSPLFTAARLVIAAALVAWILKNVDWSEFAAVWARTRWEWVAVPFLLILLSLVVSAWRWRVLLAAQGHRVPTVELFKYCLAGLFANNILPTAIGGDVVRVILAARTIGNSHEATSTVIVDRLTGLAAVFAWLALGVALRPDLVTAGYNPGIFGLIGLGVVAGLLALALALRTVPGAAGDPGSSGDPGPAGLLVRLRRWTGATLGAVRSFRNRPGALAAAFGLSLLFHGTAILVHRAAFAALDLHVPGSLFLFIVPVVFVAGLLPATPNGWGLQDGLYMVEFAWAGFDSEDALAAFLLVRASLLVSSLFGAWVFFGRRPDL